jgi:hypothetical protein
MVIRGDILHLNCYPMKTLRLLIFGTFVSLAFIMSCQRSGKDVIATNHEPSTTTQTDGKQTTGVCNPSAYAVTLESRTYINGNWQWIWSIQNLNPGNGNNGTAQDLSNWGMQLGTCVNWTSVVSAAYSGDGISWTSFAPSYQVNPSQGCLTTPIVKFDFGTTGAAKSYYRLVVSQDYAQGPVTGVYKSGTNTNCCVFNMTGIGCDGPIEINE